MTLIVVNQEDSKASYDMQFCFPPDWQARQYDEKNSFYRRKFERITGSKAVDIVAVNPKEKELWLIEVKDYRAFPTRDTQDIIGIIAKKVVDTLAGILTAAFSGEKFYKTAVKQERIRVVFHLEQPKENSKLYRQIIDWANGTRKLKQKILAIDPHAKLSNMQMNNNPWTVKEIKRL